MQPSYIKEKVLKLRSKGYSYNLITQELGLSKSTLSNWLKDVPFKPNKDVLKRIQNGPFKSGQIKHNLKVKTVSRIKSLAKKELGKITKRDLWFLGLGVYLGEGTKVYEHIRIINSDPQIVKLTIRWLKDICGLKTKNIAIMIHLYPDNNVTDCLNYWSKSLNIPLKQFWKTQIDRRTNKSEKKKRKLPYGTAHLTVLSRGNREFGVNMHRRIIGWIESALNQINKRE